MSAPRILVIDDNPTNLKLAGDVLEFAGYPVTRARSAEKALEAIAQNKPTLILLDIALPGMDGLTLARRLREDPATRDIKLIAMTAYAMPGDEQKARAPPDATATSPNRSTRGNSSRASKPI